jgi:hypothetical protein
VIDDERVLGLGEKFAETCGADWRVTCAEVAWAFLKSIVLHRAALGEMAAQLGDAFALAHELDFRKAKLLALG